MAHDRVAAVIAWNRYHAPIYETYVRVCLRIFEEWRIVDKPFWDEYERLAEPSRQEYARQHLRPNHLYSRIPSPCWPVWEAQYVRASEDYFRSFQYRRRPFAKRWERALRWYHRRAKALWNTGYPR